MDEGKDIQNFGRLPILATLYEALWYVWVLRKPIVLAILIPVCASTILAAMYDAGVLPNNTFFGWVVWLADTVAWCFAAVACHRLILLGPGSVAKFGVDGKSRREWRFFFLFCSIYVITIALFMLLSAVLQLTGIASGSAGGRALSMLQVIGASLSVPAYVVISAFVTPLSLVLPAAATDRYLDLAGATSISKGNRWRLLLLLYMLPLLIGLTSNLVGKVLPGLLGSILDSLSWWLVVPCEVAVLSVCYKRLIGV